MPVPDPDENGDEFDRIVEQLDLDLSFPEAEPAASLTDDEVDRWTRTPEPVDEEAEPFYRRVELPARPLRLGTSLAWVAVVGGPLLLVACTVFGYIVPRSMLTGLVLLFVAGAVYLFSQLPERGPADPDAPDDGAVL